jgi:hypothetical protein
VHGGETKVSWEEKRNQNRVTLTNSNIGESSGGDKRGGQTMIDYFSGMLYMVKSKSTISAGVTWALSMREPVS